MFVFLLSNLPLPIVLYLNWRVTTRFMKVRQLSHHTKVARPKRLLVGWWLSNIATVFALIPVITERRIFVQDRRWLVSYAIAASLTICGLALMNSALGEEIKTLMPRPRRRRPHKPVDTTASDTL